MRGTNSRMRGVSLIEALVALAVMAFGTLGVLGVAGEVVERGRLATTPASFRRRFETGSKARIAMEVGTHSPWTSRLLKEVGHEVFVANPRKLRLIYENRRKRDQVDAEALARVARMDTKLLAAVEHREQSTAQDLAVLRARDALVRTRTQLINHVRGAVKPTGARLKKHSSESFAAHAIDEIPEAMGGRDSRSARHSSYRPAIRRAGTDGEGCSR